MMTRPTLAAHETRLALLEQAATHDAAHDESVLNALKEIRDEIHSLRTEGLEEFERMRTKYNALDKAVAEAKATARGIGIGWAAAFTFIGGAIGAGLSGLLEWLK